MTRRMVCIGVAPRSAAASSYCFPMVTSRACTMMAGQLRFQVTRPRTSAQVPRPTNVNSCVKTKNRATPKISSGMTNERIIAKLADAETAPRHRLMPRAKATPSGTQIRVV